MRTLNLIVVLFKVQIILALWEGNPTQVCLNGKGCMSDSQCGENGKCHFPEMTISGKLSVGYVTDYNKNHNIPLICQCLINYGVI